MGLALRVVSLAGLWLAAAVTPLPGQRTGEYADPRARRLEALDRQGFELRNLWSATAERDALLERLSRVSTESQGTVVWLHGFPAEVDGGAVQSAVAGLLRSVGPVDSAVRIGVLVYNPDLYSQSRTWSTYMGAWIGEVRGRTWCVAIVPGEVGVKGLLQPYLDSPLAPCLLYAAFGKSGAGVAAWLGATRYGSIQSNHWLSRPKGWRDGYDQPPWVSLYDPSWFDDLLQARSSRLWELGLGDLTTSLAPPYQLGTQALRCLAGDPEFCQRAVLDTTGYAELAKDWPAELTMGPGFRLPHRAAGLGPRPLAGWYVSDLIREHGRERFRQFWRSSLPIEEAFQAAFGESLGRWTERWARDHWERSVEHSFRRSAIVLGATLKPSWLLLVIGWTGLALGAMAWSAQRKRVT